MASCKHCVPSVSSFLRTKPGSERELRQRQADRESDGVDSGFAFIAVFLAILTVVKTRIILIIGTGGTLTLALMVE